MSMSDSIDAVATEQPHHAANTVDKTRDMIRVVGEVLWRGSYGLLHIQALQDIVGDDDVDAGDRRFARDVVRWLAQQSTTGTDAVWQRNGDAWH